jgi:hypothetical protein
VASVKLTGKCVCFSKTFGRGPNYAATVFRHSIVTPPLPLACCVVGCTPYFDIHFLRTALYRSHVQTYLLAVLQL